MLTAGRDLTPSSVRRRCTEVVEHAATADTVPEVFAHAARRLRRLVPYDASAWRLADPTTGLPSAPGLLEDVGEVSPTCCESWRREFVDSGDRIDPACPSRRIRLTGCRPTSSFADELRVVMRAGGTVWASVVLWRREGMPPFSAAETELLESLCRPLGQVVRRAVREHVRIRAAAGADAPPGLLTFDPSGGLLSVNDHAAVWLEQLPCQERVLTSFDLAVPVWLLATAARSAGSLSTGGDGISRLLLSSPHGDWMVCQATTTRDASGRPAGTVVVLEPAGPALMAPVVAEACGLTEREQQIARHIVRGAGTAEIADELFLSGHTVRDHVKSILHKVGVGSRGALVAALCTGQAVSSPTR